MERWPTLRHRRSPCRTPAPRPAASASSLATAGAMAHRPHRRPPRRRRKRLAPGAPPRRMRREDVLRMSSGRHSLVGGRAEAASAARAVARATASSRRVATAACERLARACATDAQPGPSEHHSLTGAPSQSQRWVRARRGALLLRPDRRPCRGDHDEPGSKTSKPAQSPVTEMALHS